MGCEGCIKSKVEKHLRGDREFAVLLQFSCVSKEKSISNRRFIGIHFSTF